MTSEMSVGSIRICGEHLAHLRAQRIGPAAHPVRERPLVAIEEAAFLLEPGEERVRMHEAPVRQHDHMLAVVGDGIRTGRIDDDRAVMAKLLLEPAVAVIPVGARLLDRELVGEAVDRARMPGKLIPGTPSIWNGTMKPCQWIEVSSSRWFSTVDADILAFLEAHQRRRNRCR